MSSEIASDAPPILHEMEPTSALLTPPMEPIGRATELLLRILAKLTVYQSLPDESNLVLVVRDDVPMADACCMFLPTDRVSPSYPVIYTFVEVLRADDPPAVLETLAKSLMEISADVKESDLLLSVALEQEAKNAVFSSVQDPSPVGDYLTIFDVLFFIDSNPSPDTTVRQWIEEKRRIALGADLGDSEETSAWIRFCRESTLITRASLSLCPGMAGGQCSGSSMNLNLASLILRGNKSSGNISDLSTNSTSPKSVVEATAVTAGGSTLAAVTALLDRPWQYTLPLTVSSEKGITGVFAYTNLAQLMASVAMNCCDKLLEPFFAMEMKLEDQFGYICERNLHALPVLHRLDATMGDAVDVLRTSPIAILVDADETFHGIVTHDDIARSLSNRMDVISKYSDGARDGIDGLHAVSIEVEMNRAQSVTSTTVMRAEFDFPCSFSALLQKLLVHPSGVVVVVDRDNKPVSVITVRDVWTHAMSVQTVSEN
jgi:hypothetical protein